MGKQSRLSISLSACMGILATATKAGVRTANAKGIAQNHQEHREL